MEHSDESPSIAHRLESGLVALPFGASWFPEGDTVGSSSLYVFISSEGSPKAFISSEGSQTAAEAGLIGEATVLDDRSAQRY